MKNGYRGGGRTQPENQSVTSRYRAQEQRSGEEHPSVEAFEQKVVRRLESEFDTWEEMGEALDLNKGLLWKVAHGQRSEKVRARLIELRHEIEWRTRELERLRRIAGIIEQYRQEGKHG